MMRFLAMLDHFHETYPDVGFRLMIHFNHPDEFLLKGEDGAYLMNDNGSLKWHEDTRQAMEAVVSRGWVNIENQAPIIKGINDDADALRVMQRALYRVGVSNHYFFCGRDIVAYRHFNVPIETVWQTLNESQRACPALKRMRVCRLPTTRARPRFRPSPVSRFRVFPAPRTVC